MMFLVSTLFTALLFAMRLSTAARNAACNAVVDLIDAGGSGAGTLAVRGYARDSTGIARTTG